MLLNLLTSASLDKYNYKPELSEVLLYAVIGFIVIFVGIAFLVFMVWLVGKLIKKANAKAVKAPAKPVQEAPAKVLSKESDEVDEETIAVITAALMAFYQTNNPKCEFTVKRIKRVRRNDYA